MQIFIMPTEGRITSEFRTKMRPTHHGVDISKSGKVPILASASGEVSRSYFSKSYGNVVFIVHHINGTIYETVYAHMRLRKATIGEYVKQGQIIGYMGNTGDSTGQHLHFELHKGRWNYAKKYAVNPLLYIGKSQCSLDQEVLETNPTVGDSIVPYPGRPIKYGSRGIDVKRIQRAVKVTPDGIFGPITEAAVSAYQRRHGLQADGIVGLKTWVVMF